MKGVAINQVGFIIKIRVKLDPLIHQTYCGKLVVN